MVLYNVPMRTTDAELTRSGRARSPRPASSATAAATSIAALVYVTDFATLEATE